MNMLTGAGLEPGESGGGGGGGGGFSPSLDYSDARNSQYYFLLFAW